MSAAAASVGIRPRTGCGSTATSPWDCRTIARVDHSDDEKTATVLLDALEALTEADLPTPPEVDIPDPAAFELETAMLPRDAFPGPAEQVAADRAVGRICAEMLTPYPPSCPARC